LNSFLLVAEHRQAHPANQHPSRIAARPKDLLSPGSGRERRIMLRGVTSHQSREARAALCLFCQRSAVEWQTVVVVALQCACASVWLSNAHGPQLYLFVFVLAAS
jgi:hypothetical protein